MGGHGDNHRKAPVLEKSLLSFRSKLSQSFMDSEDDFVRIDETTGPVRGVDRSRDSGLDTQTLADWQHALLQDPKNRLALSALVQADLKTVLTSKHVVHVDQHIFNTKIDVEGSPITNQRSSGRCWLFASTNVFRVALMKRHNLRSFELSQSYLFFYDKLEKANYFLEQILDTAGEDLDSRLVSTFMQDPISDGGQWDMVYNLVMKYGLVPQVLYPDSWSAMNSSSIDSLITTKLREDALTLRDMAKSASMATINTAKEKMMREIHLILTLTLGPPPSPEEKFTWSYVEKDNRPLTLTTTPLDFARELSSKLSVTFVGCDVTKMFSLVNDPRNDYYTLLTVDRLNNIWAPGHARPITYVNVPMSVMKAACIAMLREDLPIFFGSDVGKYMDRVSGVMDTDLVDYELGFNVRLGMSKAQRLRTGESAMTHAMVLTAVHIDEKGKSVRWRVQNSWGEETGNKGYMVMTDKWMDEFCYQAVVEPRFVDEKVRKCLLMEPKVLPLWDPLGSLA